MQSSTCRTPDQTVRRAAGEVAETMAPLAPNVDGVRCDKRERTVAKRSKMRLEPGLY